MYIDIQRAEIYNKNITHEVEKVECMSSEYNMTKISYGTIQKENTYNPSKKMFVFLQFFYYKILGYF